MSVSKASHLGLKTTPFNHEYSTFYCHIHQSYRHLLAELLTHFKNQNNFQIYTFRKSMFKFHVSDVKNTRHKMYTDDVFTQGWDINTFMENVLCFLSLFSACCISAPYFMYNLNTFISLAKISCIFLLKINYCDYVHVGLFCWQRICCHFHLAWSMKYLVCCLHEFGSLHIYISRSFINIFNVHIFPGFHAPLQYPCINAVHSKEILQVSWSKYVSLKCMNIK
jgi:hypothetical protein